MSASTAGVRLETTWSSAALATPAVSNHPRRAISSTGLLSGGAAAPHRSTSSSTGSAVQALDDDVDATGQALDIVGIDRREHADAQLVAAELAVAVRVDDAIGAQRGVDRRRVDATVGRRREVDRADD